MSVLVCGVLAAFSVLAAAGIIACMRSVDAGTIDCIWIRGLKVMYAGAPHGGLFFHGPTEAMCVLIELMGIILQH